MTGIVFPDKADRPDDARLAAALGESKAQWEAILAFVAARCDGLEPEWKHYGKKHGWQVKLTWKRRALLYLVPHEGSFLAGMALRPDGVKALRTAEVPPEFLAQVLAEKPFMEGHPARVEVTGPEEASIVETLLVIKLST